MSASGRVRIGELARRTGASSDLLRVWERRYGLLSPERTPGGQRLYSRDDEERIRRMLDHLNAGLSAAEAARLVITDQGPSAGSASELGRPLAEALDGLDAGRAHGALDRLFSELGVEGTLTEVVMPYLRDVGERWECGETTVAREHFASRLLHGRLLGAAQGWDTGIGPRAVLACPPGEEHDLPLVAFGLALRRHGWRITYLGASTPVGSMAELVDPLEPRVIVLSAAAPTVLVGALDELRALAGRVPVAIGGRGINEALANDIGARMLSGDPVSAAAEVAKS
jgi:DNA-binding transcriptional MerR regulator